jgi:hypothetical protein
MKMMQYHAKINKTPYLIFHVHNLPSDPLHPNLFFVAHRLGFVPNLRPKLDLKYFNKLEDCPRPPLRQQTSTTRIMTSSLLDKELNRDDDELWCKTP